MNVEIKAMTTRLVDNSFGQVTQSPLGEGLVKLEINHQHCQAALSLYGGQVLSWQPEGERPVLWLSDSSAFQQGKAIRGGIPLCWPWFGAHPVDPNVGNHGFARQQNWQLTSVDVNAENVTVVLTWQGENIHPLWPTACRLSQTLVFGKSFTQCLTMDNLTDKAVDYTGALHSYFRVSAPENVAIVGFEQVAYDDKITDETGYGTDQLNGIGPVDRIYHTDSTMKIKDDAWQRTIEVSSEHCQDWVFWNPGKTLVQTMPDVHQGGEQEYVCLEAANTRIQKLPAQSSVSMKQKIRVLTC